MAKPDPDITVIDHPLVQHKLSEMRHRDTTSSIFRNLLREISYFLAYEVTRDLPLTLKTVDTPITRFDAPTLDGEWLALVSILRAGNVLLEGMMDLIPKAPVGHIGLYRDPDTLTAVEYYCKLPKGLPDRLVVVVDPMVATGNTAVAAIDRLIAHGARDIRFVCLLAAPEGLRHVREQHPGVHIYTAAIDQSLNDHGYIVPGLGDAGDRLFGTR